MAGSARKRPRADPGLTELDATTLTGVVAEGKATAQEVTRAFLDRIAAMEDKVGAWAHLDPEHALAQAAARDRERGTGHAVGPLHGVPVGVKDIIDVRGMPCECGTELEAGRMPRQDAFLVSRLRQAGAVILGKTVTTELAVYHPGKTRNPYDPQRTPGGSSSGSAAAVATRMAPLAVGTQTNGSVIRPAAYCGVVGYKPSRGLISRRGVLTQSPTLDAIGVFANRVEDAALLADVLSIYDADDRAMMPSAPPRLAQICASPPPMRPNLAFVRTPVWDQAEADTQEGFNELANALGTAVDEVDLPGPFAQAHAMHGAIMLPDIARNFARYHDNGRDRMSDRLASMIEDGRKVLAVDYALAHDWIELLNAVLDEIFIRYDAILTPAVGGEAPLGLESTGSPAFCTIWTYCGVPAITLPLLSGANGMPIGVQLVGARGNDARLLRTARWLVETLRIGSQVESPA